MGAPDAAVAGLVELAGAGFELGFEAVVAFAVLAGFYAVELVAAVGFGAALEVGAGAFDCNAEAEAALVDCPCTGFLAAALGWVDGTLAPVG